MLTPWLMEPGDSMPHSWGLSNNTYPEPNQSSSFSNEGCYDSILMLVFYYFYMSPLATLIHIIAKVVLFRSDLLSMLLNYKKKIVFSHRVAAFHSQCQWTRILVSLSTPMAMGTQLWFKRHGESLFISVIPKTMVSTLLSVINFNGRPFHQGYKCSYHRVQN